MEFRVASELGLYGLEKIDRHSEMPPPNQRLGEQQTVLPRLRIDLQRQPQLLHGVFVLFPFEKQTAERRMRGFRFGIGFRRRTQDSLCLIKFAGMHERGCLGDRTLLAHLCEGEHRQSKPQQDPQQRSKPCHCAHSTAESGGFSAILAPTSISTTKQSKIVRRRKLRQWSAA